MNNYTVCIDCNLPKPPESFKVNKSKCHACYKLYHKNYQSRYRQKNGDSERARNRELYQLNKTKITARKRANYAENKEKEIARKLDWQKRNPLLCALNTQRRRSKLKNNGVFIISKKDQRKLLGNTCFYCKAVTDDITIDHIIPIELGGRHSIGNLVLACKSCNCSKNDKLLMEWRVTKLLSKDV